MGSPTETPFEIKFITNEDRPAVLNFLKQTFFKDEPLNESVGLVGDDGECPALEQFAMRSIVHDVSIMATSPSGKILGVSLNDIKERDVRPEGTDRVHDEKFEKITTLLEYVDQQCDVFGRYPEIDKQLLIDIISVDSASRGQGIAQKLIERTREIARDYGIKIMRMDCSSHYSARAIAKLGFECVYTLKYEDYKVNGEVVFKPKHPHNELKIYLQRVVPRNFSTDTSTPITIDFIKNKDRPQVINFLRTFFFRDEPLNEYLKIIKPDGTCPSLEEYSLKSIVQDVSLMAVNPSGTLLGVSLNSIKYRNTSSTQNTEEAINDPVFEKIGTLLSYVDRESDIFGKYPDIDQQLSLDIISVDTKCRGQGIAQKLMDRTREIARERGIKIMRVDCTSHFSARAIAKLGFECIYTLKYEDYKVNGETVFQPEHPHNEVKIFIQRIE